MCTGALTGEVFDKATEVANGTACMRQLLLRSATTQLRVGSRLVQCVEPLVESSQLPCYLLPGSLRRGATGQDKRALRPGVASGA